MLLIGHVFIQEGDDDTNKRKKRMKVSEVKELERRTEKISKLQEKRIQKYEVRNTVFNLWNDQIHAIEIRLVMLY